MLGRGSKLSTSINLVFPLYIRNVTNEKGGCNGGNVDFGICG